LGSFYSFLSIFFFSSRRRHTRFSRDWSSDVCSSDLVGEKLYFYDSIAPIIAADSINMDVAFRASRWGKGEGQDYLNLPLDKETYDAFVQELLGGDKVVPHAFGAPKYFESCLPIEVMAGSGPEA